MLTTGARAIASAKMFFPEHFSSRSQDLPDAYHDAGQFYWGKASAWLEHKKMHSDGIGMVIPNWRVVDIDDLDVYDFKQDF